MLLSDFDFDLPDELIARYPLPARRDSRLLVLGDELEDRQFSDLPQLLSAGDLLVLNDTRVIRARLQGTKATGGKIEMLIERLLDENEVMAQVRASKSPNADTRLELPGNITAVVLGREDNLFRIKFPTDVLQYLDAHGEVPLPPYLERGEEADDAERYQTVYASQAGAVAAPTAGLHFDADLLDELEAAGISHTFVTLHVGAGTFQPLRHERVDDNRLHAERFTVDQATADAVSETRASGGRIVAVGTTSVRTLETASASGNIEALGGETSLFIRPGYAFRCVDAMITNFHLPRSSLMMLVAAFAGHERILRAYRHAVKQSYRFFSYGDAMLMWPDNA